MPATTTLLLDGFWGRPWRYGGLRRALQAAYGRAEIFHYNSSGLVLLETLAQRFIADVRRRNEPINVVAFSMGGLVVRAARLLEPTLPIQRAVFMNVPHSGTLVAHLIPLPGVRQMRPGSEFLKQLDAAPWDIPTLAIWCPGDLIVVPGSSARWARANQIIRCTVPGHAWPFHSPSVRRAVVAFFKEENVSPNIAPQTSRIEHGSAA